MGWPVRFWKLCEQTSNKAVRLCGIQANEGVAEAAPRVLAFLSGLVCFSEKRLACDAASASTIGL